MRGVAGVSTVLERRSRLDLIWAFLALVLALATVRGLVAGSRVALAIGAGTVLVVVLWLWQRRQPRLRITVTPDRVMLGGAQVVTGHLDRGPSGALVLRRNVAVSPVWILATLDRPEVGLPLVGFDLGEVRRACEQHGWWFDGVTPHG